MCFNKTDLFCTNIPDVIFTLSRKFWNSMELIIGLWNIWTVTWTYLLMNSVVIKSEYAVRIPPLIMVSICHFRLSINPSTWLSFRMTLMKLTPNNKGITRSALTHNKLKLKKRIAKLSGPKTKKAKKNIKKTNQDVLPRKLLNCDYKQVKHEWLV